MDKLGAELAARYARYQKALKQKPIVGSPGAVVVYVSLTFNGDPADLVAAGLKNPTIYGPVAYGSVQLANLGALADLPIVENISEQETVRSLLDVSVPAANVPSLWTGTPSYQGEGVVVGVVDTGIDVFHHSFRNPDGTTRILFLWDQVNDKAPHPNGFSYGKHFTKADIDAALTAGKFEHRDSDGHGTHVAGTAAGDGSQSGTSKEGDCIEGADTYIGVAPKADLIIVKRNSRSGAYVDGISYIFDMAGSRPAVANLSIGSPAASHDGTSKNEVALDIIMALDSRGRAIVVANGNSADEGYHAHKTVSANGNATMNFTVLANDRYYVMGFIWYGSSGQIGSVGPGANARLRVEITAPDGTSKSLDADVSGLSDVEFAGGKIDFFARTDVDRVGRHRTWFRLMPPPNGTLAAGNWEISLTEISAAPGTATEVDCWLSPSTKWQVEDKLEANATKELKFYVPKNLSGTSSCSIVYTGDARISTKITTPDPDSTPAVAANAGSVSHDAGDDHSVLFNTRLNTPDPGQHIIEFSIDAKKDGDCVDKGDWLITLTETAGHPVDYHAVFPVDRPWVKIEKAGGKKETVENQPTFVEAEQDRSRTVESPAAADSVIAVGAYDPRDNSLADFSSRGPTVDGRQKPDLCAPGVAITAPKTRVKDSPCVSDCCENFYENMQGTSMAAPHVAGVVALMLQRNPTLSFEEVRDALRDEADPVAGADPNDWGEGRLDAQASVMSVAEGPGAGGGGGGGGGGGPSPRVAVDGAFLPPRAVWPWYLPTPERLRELHGALGQTAAGQLVAAMLSTHFDEVKAIVNRSCRAAAAWHRLKGPELLQIALSWPGETRAVIPAKIDEVCIASGLEKLLQAVAHSASPALRQDIERYRSLIVRLPGTKLSDLDTSTGGLHGN